MALQKFTQPQVNALRSLLGQEGWAKDFGDFYDAGKALSEWPKEKYLPSTARPEEFARLGETVHEFEVSDKAKGVIEKALRHYIARAAPPTQEHFAIMMALGIERL